jgi:hypothetical protein
MTTFKYLIAVFSILILSSCNNNKEIQGVWVRKTPSNISDTLIIDKKNNDFYTIKGHATIKGKKINSKIIDDAEFKNDTMFLKNGNIFQLNKTNEFLINGVFYIRIE